MTLHIIPITKWTKLHGSEIGGGFYHNLKGLGQVSNAGNCGIN